MGLTQNEARKTSIIKFWHVDGSVQGGVVGSTLPETFTVTSVPRYGDVRGRTFRYEEVAEIIESTPREYVRLKAALAERSQG